MLVALALAFAPLLGMPMPLAWLAAGVPFFLVLRSRGTSVVLALSVVSTGALLVLVATLVITALTHLPPLVTICFVYAVLGATGVLIGPVPRWPHDRIRVVALRRLLTMVAPLTGAVVWLLIRVASIWVPGAATTAWATLNDGANSLLFGRQIIIDGGIRLDVDANPVPMVAAVIGAMMMPGRSKTATAAHDVYAFLGAWTLLVALLCIAIGLLCGVVLRQSSGIISIVGPAVASVLPMTWLIGGLSLEYGYINVAPTVLLLVFAVTAAFEARRHAALSLAVLIVTGLLVMTCWSPMTLIPCLLAVLVLVRERERLLQSSIAAAAALGLLVVAAVVVAIVFVLPTFGASREALDSDVGFYPFRLGRVLLLVLVAAVLAGLIYWRLRDAMPLLVLAAVGAGGGAAVAVFLYARRGQQRLWAYYPLKALWFLLILMLLLAVVYAFAALAAFTSRTWAAVAGTLLICAGTVAYGAWMNTVPGYGSMNVATRILSGAFLYNRSGDAAWSRILGLADERPRGILWRSGDPNESFIDFWLVKLSSPRTDDQELHALAYTIDRSSVRDLCRYAELVGVPLRVETADGGLPDQAAGCNNRLITVKVTS